MYIYIDLFFRVLPLLVLFCCVKDTEGVSDSSGKLISQMFLIMFLIVLIAVLVLKVRYHC